MFCSLISVDFIVFRSNLNYLTQDPVFFGRKNRGSRGGSRGGPKGVQKGASGGPDLGVHILYQTGGFSCFYS